MKYQYLCCLLLLATFQGLAQSADYFQQEVDYRIELTLNDLTHEIFGVIEMDYTNNSPDELGFIYLHLWANAFSDRNTAFTRQKVRQGSSRFYFAKDKNLGNYSELEFTVDGQSASLELQADNPDIAKLVLPQALRPGQTIAIRSPFRLKIPGSFSRLGRVGESYQMTQWYTTPAVYDRAGWHPLPYLDMGEYYSEFGSFDVSITLPKNYIVAATGELQTASEIAFLSERIAETDRALAAEKLPDDDDFPPSDEAQKTIRFTAEEVHDFAWFADKRFYVQKSEVELSSGRKIDTWAYFTNTEGELWRKGTLYVDRAVEFYSDKVGEYPYPQATAVQSALSAGGGMEYPMITVIGLAGNAYALDQVITHEVGHNWFYGILAFDERVHPWLDEGINSYYDHRYMEDNYAEDETDFLPPFLMKTTDYSLLELAYLYQARRNLDQAPATSSDDFSRINYFLGAYEKPAVVIKYLEKYLGTERFDRIMRGFYKEWKFKHPGPQDFQTHLVRESGESLDWFFEGFLYSNDKLDYQLAGIREGEDAAGEPGLRVKVRNRGDIAAPFSLSGMRDTQLIHTQWYSGTEKVTEVDFPGGDYDRLVIDAERITPDLYRKNNVRRTSGLFPGAPPLKFKFPLGIEHSTQSTVFVTPLLTWNNYDKTLAGLAFYNSPLPAKRFEYTIAPFYGFASGDLTGLLNLQYHAYVNNKWLRRATVELNAKRFNYTYNWPDEYYLTYNKVVPTLRLDLASKPNGSFYHYLQYRAIILNEDRPQFSTDSLTRGDYLGNENLASLIHEVTYWGGNRRAINPWSYRVALEQQSYDDFFGTEQSYLKLSAEWKGAYTYKRGRSVNVRLFAGGFLNNTRENAGNFYTNASNRSTRGSLALTYQGYNDDKYDDFFLGRNENRGIWSQQVAIRDGGMKNAFGSSFTNVGLSNSFIFAVNLDADLPERLPLGLPLKPYLDLGYFSNATPLGEDATFDDQFLWSFGVMLSWFDGRLAVYFPLANSENIREVYRQRGNYFTRITYTLNLRDTNPFELVNNISF